MLLGEASAEASESLLKLALLFQCPCLGFLSGVASYVCISHGHTHIHTREAKVLPAHSITAYIFLDSVIQLILNLNLKD